MVVRTLGAPEALAVIALSIANRERILRAVEDCPDGLAELGSVILREHEWRMREGLVQRPVTRLRSSENGWRK